MKSVILISFRVLAPGKENNYALESRERYTVCRTGKTKAEISEYYGGLLRTRNVAFDFNGSGGSQ